MMILPVLFSLSLWSRSVNAWNLADSSLDHYSRAIRQVGDGDYLRGIETARAAARHAGGQNAWVNLAGFYLNLFNKEDYQEPVSHVQALELFAIAHYGITRWPSFHGSIRNMESTLRWLCSSAPESAGLRYDKTLDGTNTWRLPPLQSTGDRLAAVRYGLEHAPSAEDAVQDRGPIFIPRPYQAFRRDTEKELARIKRLQQMAKQGRGQFGRQEWLKRREMYRRKEMHRRREMEKRRRRRSSISPMLDQSQNQRRRKKRLKSEGTANDL